METIMKHKYLFSVLLLPAFLLMSTTAKSTELLLNSFLAPQHPVTQIVIKPWAKRVSEVTQGRVKVDVAPASIAAPQQQLAGVIKGVFDISYQFHGLLTEQAKLNQITHLPFINTTSKGSSVALWHTYQKYFVKANELSDVHVLALFVLPPGVMFGMSKPIASIEDLKGQKVYSISGVPAKMLEATGAGVVVAPAARSYEIISGKTVDAFAGYSVSDSDGLKTLPYATDITDLPGSLTAPSFVLFINKKRWAALSPEDREAITAISGEAFAQNMKIYDELEATTRAKAAASGVKFHMATPAFTKELQTIAAPIVASWLADADKLGVDGKAAMDFYRAESEANK